MKLKQIGSNMTELHLNNGTVVLFSYETPVAALLVGGFGVENGFIKTNKKWSNTTTKHINQWLAMHDQQGIGDTSAIPVDQSVLDALVE